VRYNGVRSPNTVSGGPTGTRSENADGGGGLSPGARIGISLGVSFGVILFGLMFFLWRYKLWQKKSSGDNVESEKWSKPEIPGEGVGHSSRALDAGGVPIHELNGSSQSVEIDAIDHQVILEADSKDSERPIPPDQLQ
jgi:hypothetical protein